MALLSDLDRQRTTNALMRFWSMTSETVSGITKFDLRAAVNSTDAWQDQNTNSYNTSLPVASRTNLTAGQKTLLFCAVALTRAGVGILRKFFGEVD